MAAAGSERQAHDGATPTTAARRRARAPVRAGPAGRRRRRSAARATGRAAAALWRQARAARARPRPARAERCPCPGGVVRDESFGVAASTPLPRPNVRTATISGSTGGCGPRPISQADVAVSATPQPSAAAPSATASARRPRRPHRSAFPLATVGTTGTEAAPLEAWSRWSSCAGRRRAWERFGQGAEVDDAVAHGEHLGSVADHQQGAARGECGQGVDDRGLGVGVDPFGGLVEEQQRAVGHAGRAPPVAAAPWTGPRRPRRRGCRAARRGRPVRPRPPRHRGRRAGRGDVVGDRARQQHRPLRHPRDPPQPGVPVHVGEIDPADGDPSRVRDAQAEQQVEEGGLAHAAAAAQADARAGWHGQVEPVQHPAAAATVGDEPGDAHRHPRGVGGRCRARQARAARAPRTPPRPRPGPRRSRGNARPPHAAAGRPPGPARAPAARWPGRACRPRGAGRS